MPAALHIHELRKSFGDTVAVDGVSLEVQPGKVTALLGPSGCGKTTTLRMLAGLERPDAGSISINERVLNDDTTFVKPEHRRIGLVFQDYALFPHLTVAQNIAYGAKGEDTQGLLAELDLQACAARLPHPFWSPTTRLRPCTSPTKSR